MLNNRQDAYALLISLDAPDRLLRHLKLVGEAADLLIYAFKGWDIEFDAQFIRLGAAIHDAGKAIFVEELDQPGSRHEAAGQALMLAHGVQPEVAKCCVSHAAWEAEDISLEELVVALADKLWKAKREELLELRMIDVIAAKKGLSRWDMFVICDAAFEEIAAGAADRLSRS